MNSKQQLDTLQSRRKFLTNSGMGLGTAALTSLVPNLSMAGTGGPHFAPKAKRVIFLFMAGAPSQVDLFDYKPNLTKLFKKELPESIRGGQRVTAMTKGKEKLIAPTKFKFAQQGESGVWMSELLPNLSKHADKLCLVHSMNTDAINHDPGKTSFCTGSEIPGKPSMGAWLSYGLGSINKDLPNYVVMPSAFWSGRVNVQALYSRLWGSGFLPSKHQGHQFSNNGRSGFVFIESKRESTVACVAECSIRWPTSIRSIILKSAIQKSKRRSLNRKWLSECKARYLN